MNKIRKDKLEISFEDFECPESVKAIRYPGRDNAAEIQKENWFATSSWLEQPFRCWPSEERSDDIPRLFGDKDCIPIAYVASQDRNEGQYVAFRAIAHNVATLNSDRLCLSYQAPHKQLKKAQRTMQLWCILVGFEPPRVCRRLHSLRGWSYEQTSTIFT